MRRKTLGIVLLLCVALCILAFPPLLANGQEVAACAGHGSSLVTFREGRTYFSSWDSVPHFFVVTSPTSKPKELINLPDHSFFLFRLLFRHSKNPKIVPAPCTGKWNGREFVFEASNGIWVYSFSKKGTYLTAKYIHDGSAANWTPGGGLTYLTPNNKLSTYPAFGLK